MAFLVFKPIYKERVWGGRNLADTLGRNLPDGQVIGESWEIVDRPEAMSTTPGGLRLREIIANDPESVMGPDWPPVRPFPILVKWLDCQDKLSLQVHPPEPVAARLGGEPKTENWYIAGTEPGAYIMAGLKKGVTREQFEAALQKEALEPLIHGIETKSGDSIFIESGRIHAIGGGNLILEIQQNSDTTYRVYDWGRVGLDGQPRQLHVEQSLLSIDFNDFEPKTVTTGARSCMLAQSEVFDLHKVCLHTGEMQHVEPGQPRIISMIRGHMSDQSGAPIRTSENALLPASERFTFTAEEDTEFLLTENFNRV